MTVDALVNLLLAIIGVLITTLIGFFVYIIMRDIAELKDMFIRHVRDSEIHLQRKKGLTHD